MVSLQLVLGLYFKYSTSLQSCVVRYRWFDHICLIKLEMHSNGTYWMVPNTTCTLHHMIVHSLLLCAYSQ